MTELSNAPSLDELALALRDEARFRPTIWGDARPLLIEAAKAVERLIALVAACEPFARTADEMDDTISPFKHPDIRSVYACLGDCRKVKEALDAL